MKLNNKLEKLLIDVALKIAKQGKGCLLVIVNGKLRYDPMVEELTNHYSVFDFPRRLEANALVDGAVIITPDGLVVDYSAKIDNKKTFKNFGTRHSAALNASLNGNIAILSSEEDRKVRIFKKGKLVMQLDALQKGIENQTAQSVSLLESVGVGAIGSISASVLVPSLGIALLPGVIIFGSAYHLGKLMQNARK